VTCCKRPARIHASDPVCVHFNCHTVVHSRYQSLVASSRATMQCWRSHSMLWYTFDDKKRRSLSSAHGMLSLAHTQLMLSKV
jgi:hypothetical protein